MTEARVEQVREVIIGMRPVYTDTGNATELWLPSGEVLVDRRGIKAVLAALGRSYAVDLKAQRQQLGQLFQRSGGVLPFYLGRRVFVPVKMRKAITKNDMVYGYLDADYISDIKGGKFRQCRVLLKTGQELEGLSSPATAQQSWYLGLSLLKELAGDAQEAREEQQIMASVLALCRGLKEMARRLERIEEHIAEAEFTYHYNREDPGN